MLSFQTVAILCTMLPNSAAFIASWCHALRRRLKGPAPADRFAAVVYAAMQRNPHILARKFADRWLLKCALGQGLGLQCWRCRRLHAGAMCLWNPAVPPGL